MSKRRTLAVVIGRFQIAHVGHHKLFREAADIADHTLVILGSAYRPRTFKNPFTVKERALYLREVFNELGLREPSILEVKDYEHSEEPWLRDVQHVIEFTKRHHRCDDVVIVGHHKDESSYYLDNFPQYAAHEVDQEHVLDATYLREDYFSNDDADVEPLEFDNLDRVSDAMGQFLIDFKINNNEEFNLIKGELEYNQKYKEMWKDAPFVPIFVTTDAVVLCEGHVLLVKRRTYPGKGLWALPGGFIDPNELLIDSMVRELKEETRIKVDPVDLKNNVRRVHVFDAPKRSTRGRTITHAYLVVLNNVETLPKVRGSDDAERAKWFSLAELYNMSENMFEDHAGIITYMIGGTTS